MMRDAERTLVRLHVHCYGMQVPFDCAAMMGDLRRGVLRS